MKTVDIKGKPYVEVNERIKHFRANYDGWSLLSEIVSDIDGKVIVKATILDEKGTVRATGHAYEKDGSTFINKTSYIENCETSAWGRALGNLGIGIDASVATAEEVGNAIKQQEKTNPSKELLSKKGEQCEKLRQNAYTSYCNKYADKIDAVHEFDPSKLDNAMRKILGKMPTTKAEVAEALKQIKPEDIIIELPF